MTESVPDPVSEENKDKEPTYHDETKLVTLNSMIPLWKKNKSEAAIYDKKDKKEKKSCKKVGKRRRRKSKRTEHGW